ncbi:MAG: FAD-dependent oxidoreductase [Alphaproteobacteria bacterium]|nr:FAD-dependent oxidoreductase [Alphaproteobacteria bacterium]
MRIAVIGTGVAGLATAWLLARRHDVTVYERETRLGGHSNTVDTHWPMPGGARTVPVDTGFIVYNTLNYPNLTALFDTLGVATKASTMSFAVSIDDGRLEYVGDETRLFVQKRNLLRPRYLRMLLDIVRFNRLARRALEQGTAESLRIAGTSLGDWLAAERFSRAFMDDHILPIAAAIWSCPVETMLAFPAASFLAFFRNHGLLQIKDRPQWRTVEGGSRSYVQRLAEPLAGKLRLGTPVRSVARDRRTVIVTDGAGHADRFDQAVIAAHADEALAMLEAPTPDERQVLGAFGYQENTAILHADPHLMPRRRGVWAAWNYLADRRKGSRDVSVTYWMNVLQGIPAETPLFVSLNPLREPAAATTFGRFTYHHPVFDGAAVAAQSRLASLQGRGGIWFCGSYCGYGFHEDALAAGQRVARALGCAAPWDLAPPGGDDALALAAD